INGAGEVAGWYAVSHPQAAGANHAFVWRNGDLQDLPALGGTNSFAQAINDAGLIAGSAQLTNGQMRAVIWRNGKPADLGTLGGGFSHAYGVNSSGDVVGVAGDTNWNRRAFIWSDGKMRSLGTLGGSFSQANAINDRGDVCGVAMMTNGQLHAFLVPESKGKMKDLGTFGGEFSFAYALNSYDVVGTAETKTRERHAFLYHDKKLKDLNTLIPEKSGWLLTEATAITENGRILCMGHKSDGLTSAVLLTPQAAASPKGPVR
ncbi:MAG: hypothetical protein HY300_08105, partial [Verrucomicrobia bacterium]|nr:hypothetical protein [Verrucomicrobiota bacterium]